MARPRHGGFTRGEMRSLGGALRIGDDRSEFGCGECLTWCVNAAALKVHRATAHPKTGAKEVCPTCAQTVPRA